MLAQELKPGDKVVELAAVVRSAACLTGAVAAASLLWLIAGNQLLSAGGLMAGSAAGYIVAQAIARLGYRSATGQTAVVKAGVGAFPAALLAGLAGGLSTAILVALLAVGIFGLQDHAASLFLVSLGCGAVLGGAVACVVALL
jgi:hypothetical protein